MPTRKQRRRRTKEQRHEYVWADEEGNELDPVEIRGERASKPEPARNGGKTAAQQKGRQARGRAARVPPVPSWDRAIKRSLLLGAVVFVLFSLTAKGNTTHRYIAALIPAAIYTVLFIPFTFFVDRFAYNRYQQRQGGGGGPKQPPAKKR